MAGLSDGGGGSGAVRAGRAFIEIGIRGTKSILGTLDNLKQKFLQLGQFMMKAGAAAGAAGALALRPVILTFTDFDDAIRAVKAAVGATEDEFVMLRERALELGRTTSFAAAEVAKLMIELGRAGFVPDQISVMTEAVLDMARATGTDAALSAGIMSAAIRQFGLDAKDAAEVADILTAGANLSFNSIESLGESLKYVGPVAKGMGVSLTDAVALLGTLGNMGIQGSEAGTALRRILTAEGAAAADFMRVFGVNSVDAAGNVRPLVDVLDDVAKSVAHLGNAERAAKFEELFGLLGITSAVAISENAKSARELKDQIAAAGGIAKTTAQEMDGGLGGGLRRLKGAAEGVVLSFGSAVVPAMKTVARILELAAGAVRLFISNNSELAQTLAGVLVGVTVAGVALAALGVTVTAVAGGLGVIASALGAVLGVVGALLSPVTLLTAGLVALGVQYLRNSEIAGKAFDFMKAGFTELNATFQTSWGGIVASVQKGDLEGAFKIAGAGLRVEWEKVVLFWTEQWVKFKNGFLKDIKEMGDRVANSFLGKTATEFKNLVEKGQHHLTQGMRVVFKAAGIGPNGRPAPVAGGAPGGPVAPAPEDPAIAAAKKRLADAEAALRGLVDAATQPLPALDPGIGAAEKKRLEEEGLLAPPPRPVLDVAAVRGGFSALNARQMFGIGDSWAKKQVDELKAIKDGAGKLPMKIGEQVFAAMALR